MNVKNFNKLIAPCASKGVKGNSPMAKPKPTKAEKKEAERKELVRKQARYIRWVNVSLGRYVNY